MVAARAWAISPGSLPMASATSLMAASRPRVVLSCSRTRAAFTPSSLMLRLTFTVPPSRKRRRISPRITGTA